MRVQYDEAILDVSDFFKAHHTLDRKCQPTPPTERETCYKRPSSSPAMSKSSVYEKDEDVDFGTSSLVFQKGKKISY